MMECYGLEVRVRVEPTLAQRGLVATEIKVPSSCQRLGLKFRYFFKVSFMVSLEPKAACPVS